MLKAELFPGKDEHMKVLVTGSAGHLGEAMVRTLKEKGYDVTSLDLTPSPYTSVVGSVTDRFVVRQCMESVKIVFHMATLHKPHVATHSKQQFIDTNISGTLLLLEEAVRAHVSAFIFTSTTSVFGDALVPPPGLPAAWITEAVNPVPKNIYGISKESAEQLCRLYHRTHGLPCLVLRTSRFFPEEDDNRARREAYADDNLKVNEYLFRRVDLEDAVNAHILAGQMAGAIGFDTYIISASSPFQQSDLADLRIHADRVVKRLFPDYEVAYAQRGWTMFEEIDRVYANEKARKELGWAPRYDFRYVLDQLHAGRDFRSPLARVVGSKGYHTETFLEGPYPV